jgi:hypothetical protein
MRGKVAVLMVALTLSLAGCRLFDQQRMCTLNLVWGISVQVRDSVNGALGASGAKLVARSGTYADSMSYPAGHPEMDAGTLVAAGEHAGLFTVTITKAGYRDWTKNDVRVTGDECHVNTTELTALLQPLP